MFRNNIFTILLFGSLCAGVTVAGAEVIIADDFESGDLSTTNKDGFKWAAPMRTSIVTRNASCANPGDDVVIWSGKAACTVLGSSDPRDWTAKRGNNSLRFRYAAGQEWTEQRFDPGKGYPEIWLSYWIRVPVNFSRGTSGSLTNNKWFKMWMGDQSLYDKPGVSQFNTQDWPGSPATNIDVVLAYDNAAGKGGKSGTYTNYVTPADAGKWMHVVYHMKASSGGGAKNGRISWYRKWEGGSYETIADLKNIEIAIGKASTNIGYNGWGAGYILGYANRAYAKDTEWLVDEFVISTTSLLNAAVLSLPLPPNKLAASYK